MQANKILTHDQSSTAVGYTPEGAWAGKNSVLVFRSAGGYPWTSNPWENAPFHLAQLLQPGLRALGYADDGLYACMTTWPGADPAGLSGVYTYPGSGRTNVPVSQAAKELPSTPQQSVGIAANATTGPNLMVFAHGLGGSAVRVTAASLTPTVQVKWVDNSTPTVGGYIPSGAILIPVTPLTPNTTYTATVELSGSERSTSHTWSFTTGSPASALGPATTALSLRASFARSGRKTARITGSGVGKILLTVKSKGKPLVKRTVRASASGVFTGTVKAKKPGKATICASSGKLKLCKTLVL